MKFPFIKLEYHSKNHNPIWVDIRTIAQVYENDEATTKLCTTAEEQDFPVWDSVDSVMKRIADYYDGGGIMPNYQAIAAKKKSSFFDDYNI